MLLLSPQCCSSLPNIAPLSPVLPPLPPTVPSLSPMLCSHVCFFTLASWTSTLKEKEGEVSGHRSNKCDLVVSVTKLNCILPMWLYLQCFDKCHMELEFNNTFFYSKAWETSRHILVEGFLVMATNNGSARYRTAFSRRFPHFEVGSHRNLIVFSWKLMKGSLALHWLTIGVKRKGPQNQPIMVPMFHKKCLRFILYKRFILHKKSNGETSIPSNVGDVKEISPYKLDIRRLQWFLGESRFWRQ